MLFIKSIAHYYSTKQFIQLYLIIKLKIKLFTDGVLILKSYRVLHQFPERILYS